MLDPSSCPLAHDMAVLRAHQGPSRDRPRVAGVDCAYQYCEQFSVMAIRSDLCLQQTGALEMTTSYSTILVLQV